MATRVFLHDCERCVCLGNYMTPGLEGAYDLYFCPGHPGASRPTVIARWSSEGSDYVSGFAAAEGMRSLLDTNEPTELRALRVAYLIARDAGLAGE